MKMSVVKNLEDRAMDYEEVIAEIAKSSVKSSVYVGADSKQFSKKGVDWVAYVAVVIIHHDSKHGGRIFRAFRTQRDYGNLRQRLMLEVSMAIEISMKIVDVVGDRPFQIHLDINPLEEHGSSVCVKEATGYVLGTLGFMPKLKPEAFAASAAADKWAVLEASKRRTGRNKKVSI